MNHCIVVADAQRARFRTLSAPRAGGRSTKRQLEEITDLINPGAGLRDAELLSETRPGARQGMPGAARHTVDDGRESRRREVRKRFSADIVQEIGRICRPPGAWHLVLAASPQILGMLRGALSRASLGALELHEINRDLTGLTSPQLHDYLADGGLIPRRARAGLANAP